MVLATTVLVLVLSDIGPPPPECVADRDCVLSTFGGCCGDCCPVVRAAPKGKDERAPCKTMNCASPPCAEVVCQRPAPDLDLYAAACVARRCEAVLKVAECRVATDCRLVEVAPPEPGRCACPEKRAEPVDAGTVVFDATRRCARCPPEPPARAACQTQTGRCIVVWQYSGTSKKR